MKLIKEVKQITHRFTTEELAELSQKNAQLNIEIEDKKQEGKNVASDYSNKVKVLEARRNDLSHRIISKYELRDVFCYARKNFETSTIEYISMDGEIVATEAFRPSDYRKQLELKEEVAQNKLERVAYFGAKYFYEEFLKINFELDVTEAEVEQVLEDNRVRFVAKCITELVDKKVLEIEDDIEFDAMFQVVSEWYDGFKTKYRDEPKEEDYKVEEEQPAEEEKDEPIQNTDEVFPTDLPEKPKKSKGKKKEEQKPAEPEDGDEDGTPLWLD